MSKPSISIAMPVRNCEKTVAASIRSVLKQTFDDWQLLVLDDGSTDGTLDEARRFRDERIRIFEDRQSKGLPARLNEAISLSEGEFYARMDGDDVCYPERLAVQVQYARRHPEINLLGGGLCVFGEKGRVLGKRMPPGDHWDICRRPYSGFPLAHPAFFGRKTWFESWRFRLEAGGACDQDLLLRSYGASKFANIDDIIIGYREEKIVLRKCVSYRVAFCRSLVANCRRGRLLSTGLGVALAAAKLGVDTIAISTGLQHRILRHRASPVRAAERAEWERVWESVNCPVRSEG